MQRNCWQVFYSVFEQSITLKADGMGLQAHKSSRETVYQVGVSAEEPGIAAALIRR